MRSIKPGRGPSMMSGIASIGTAFFGLIWTILACSMGGGLFGLFGIFFIFMAIASAIYNFKNATSPNRYSMYDITEHGEEQDPLNMRYGNNVTSKFCPYCGAHADVNYEFCNYCGKKLP